tara:strand:+ start:595 stop:759 length:165 start_codon:yes stop_codon:yes gene_type:complete
MIKSIGIMLLMVLAVTMVMLMTEHSPFKYGLLNDWLLVIGSGLTVLMYQEVMRR